MHLSSAKSIHSALRSSRNIGQECRGKQISRRCGVTTFQVPMSGRRDFPAKMSLWREWAREQGLKGAELDSFTSLLESLEKDAPELFYSKTFTVCLIPTEDRTLRSSFERWPTSGILSDGVCLTAKTSESPSHAKESTLSGVIETGAVPQKYFLSPTAAKGMLRRVDAMGRNLFPPLRKSLEMLAAKAPSSKALPTASTPVLPGIPGLTGAERTCPTRAGATSVD